MALIIIDSAALADKWSQAVTKINNCIRAVNKFTGGSVGQIFVKTSNSDFEGEWIDIPPSTNGLPSGGTSGQALIKNSTDDFDADFQDIHQVPAGGFKDYVLTKNSDSDFDTRFTTISKTQMVGILPIHGNSGTCWLSITGDIATITFRGIIDYLYSGDHLFDIDVPVPAIARISGELRFTSSIDVSGTLGIAYLSITSLGKIKPTVSQTGTPFTWFTVSYIIAQ